MNTWIKLTDEVMHEMEGQYWLATIYGTVIPGEYMWEQGHSPDRFYTDHYGYYIAKEITHVMKFTPPKHPLEE